MTPGRTNLKLHARLAALGLLAAAIRQFALDSIRSAVREIPSTRPKPENTIETERQSHADEVAFDRAVSQELLRCRRESIRRRALNAMTSKHEGPEPQIAESTDMDRELRLLLRQSENEQIQQIPTEDQR